METPDISVEFFPGSPATFVDPPGLVPTQAELDQKLSENGERAMELGTALANFLNDRIDASVASALELRNHLQGAVESRLTDATLRAQGIAEKLHKALNKQLGGIYPYAFQYGYQYPTTEEAYARLVSGTSQPTPTVGGPTSNGVSGNLPVGLPGPVGSGPTVGGNTILPSLPVPGPPAFVPPVSPITPVTPPASPVPPQPAPGPVAAPPQSPPIQAGPGVVPISPNGTIPTVGSSASGANQSPTCPPGYSYASSTQYGTTISPSPAPTGFDPSRGGYQPIPGAPGSTKQTGPRGVQPAGGLCLPVVTGGWTTQWTMPLSDPLGNVLFGSPWIEQIGEPPNLVSEQVCFDACYLGSAAGGGQIMCVRIPQGMHLCVPDNGGPIIYAAACPNNFQPLPLVSETSPADQGGGNGAIPPGCVPNPPAGGTCPTFGPATCAAPSPGVMPTLGVGDSDFCKSIDDAINKYVDSLPNLSDWIGMGSGTEQPGTVGKAILAALTGTSGPLFPSLFKRFADYAQQILTKLNAGVNCDPRTLMPIVLYRAAVEFVHRWTGIMPEQLRTLLDQAAHYVCQVTLPSVAEANRAYLADQIVEDVWTCWVKAAGHHVIEAKAVRDSERMRPTFQQAQRLYVRNLITQDRYDKLTRAAGVLDDQDKSDLSTFDNYFPSIGEIFKWQQEQLYSEDVISRFQLDQGFEDAYAQTLQAFTDGHQMDHDNARRHYMSIWRRPGYAEMVEATRRLRQGRVDDSLVFSEDDLNTALKQEGYNDYWIPRLAKLREHVPTRRDVHSLYMNHVIDETEVKSQWQDEGFSSDFADMQTQQLKIERQLADYHKAGFPAAGTLASLYARGELSKQEFNDLAQRVVYYDGQLDDMTAAASTQENIENKRLALTGVRSQFTAGLLDASGVASALATAGIDGDQIQRLTQYWTHLKKSTPKQVGASQLCTWRKDNLIGPIEQSEALTRLGYERTDVNLIVADCTAKIVQANEKAAAAAQKAATAAATKAAKAQTAAAKAAAKAAKTTPAAG